MAGGEEIDIPAGKHTLRKEIVHGFGCFMPKINISSSSSCSNSGVKTVVFKVVN